MDQAGPLSGPPGDRDTGTGTVSNDRIAPPRALAHTAACRGRSPAVHGTASAGLERRRSGRSFLAGRVIGVFRPAWRDLAASGFGTRWELGIARRPAGQGASHTGEH